MSILTGTKIETAVNRAIEKIDARRTGQEALGLKTQWGKLNDFIGGGFQWGYNYLIAGLSGSGKSTLSNIIETDIFDLNPEQKFIVLNFNFETDSAMNLIKKFSADTDLTVTDLMSSKEALDDAKFGKVVEKSKRFTNYPIYYFDVSGTTDDIEHTILAYYAQFGLPMFCILDHTGLVTPQNRENELEMVANLAKLTIKLKKQLPITFLKLGQLNSNIESDDRKTNPSLHQPGRADLFGGKAVWNAMDCVFMPHRPELLKIDYYTLDEHPTTNKMFFHIVKQRFGDVGTVLMDTTKIGQNIILEI